MFYSRLTLLLFIFASSCKPNPIDEELKILSKDILSLNQIDSILIRNDIPDSTWNIHKIDSIEGTYIPENLYDCFDQLNSIIPDSLKTEMKLMSNEKIIGEHHFRIGLWIRNNWGLWQKSRLWMYFYNKGISHPDDISSLILKSYHRKITANPLLLQEEINDIREAMEENKRTHQKEKDRAIFISEQVEQGDSIEFQIPIELESNTTFFYGYPALVFGDQIELRDSMLLIKGLVLEKAKTETDSISNYRIKILELSRRDVNLFENKGIGDEIELEAGYLYLLDK